MSEIIEKQTVILGPDIAILKARSPSCGSKQVYDWTHSKKLVDGMGVTAQLLTQNGIKVFDETEIDAAIYFAQSN